MVEEVTPTAVVTPTISDGEESYINPDGTYKEGWKEALLPENMREMKFYDSPFNANLKELLKTAGNQAEMLGKKGVVPIDENSNEFERQAWRKAHGVPDKYNYQKPTDLNIIDLSDEFVNQTMERFNKVNMSQKQVDTVMEVFHDYWKGRENEFAQAEQAEATKVNQEILQSEGVDYETNQLYIDNAVRKFTEGWPDEDVLALFPTSESEGQTSDKNVKLLRRKFLINVGKMMGEHKTVTGDIGGKSLQEQLDEVMKSEAYTKGIGKEHTEAINKALKLREQINAQIKR